MKRTILLSTIAGLLLTGATSAQDWPNLKRYQAADEKLRDSTVLADFMGDSITQFWFAMDSGFFQQRHYLDRGISGQTSTQMLLRFRQDVINLHPRAVVILCGTNDIAGNTGPMTLRMTEDNIETMTELARAHRIKVILCSVLPANRFGWKPDVQPADSITRLNSWIAGYAKRRHLVYVDYYSSMVDDRKGLNARYSRDGVHPNPTGYAVMEPLVEAAIRKAL
jgi:lysophospholipase L1-like esterase